MAFNYSPRQVRTTSPIVLPALIFSSWTFLPESLLVFWLNTIIGPGPIILTLLDASEMIRLSYKKNRFIYEAVSTGITAP